MHPKWQSNTSILQFRLILDCLEICTNKITWSIVVASSVQVAPERILFVGANPQSPKIIPFTNYIHVKEHFRIVECLLILPHFFSGEPVLRVQALFLLQNSGILLRQFLDLWQLGYAHFLEGILCRFMEGDFLSVGFKERLSGVVLGFFWLQRFSADEAMCCLQIALSHFAA